MDVVLSEFYNCEIGKYEFKGEGVICIFEEMVIWYEEMIIKYLIIFIEDGLDENDWDGFKLFIECIGDCV